jgi:acetoin utilization deacetylase AcuC-like enzyme
MIIFRRPHHPAIYMPTTLPTQMNKFARLAYALSTNCKTTNPRSNLPRPLLRDLADCYRPVEYLPHEWLSPPVEATYLDRFLSGQLSDMECRRIGFDGVQMRRPELIRRTVLEVAGTILTAQLALRYGLAAHLAGGTHHAQPTHGAGYTILNDLAIAAHLAPVDRVLVIDCDVHQGDGTAVFGATTKELRGKLFTLSLHCASNYPHPKAYSTFDVGLPDKMLDDEYLHVLQQSVITAVDTVKPDLILYDAGVDIYSGDRLGRLRITEDGIRARDRWVVEYCVIERGIPVAAVIGGGYDRDVDALARRHGIVHEECSYVWRKHHLWEQKIVDPRNV